MEINGGRNATKRKWGMAIAGSVLILFALVGGGGELTKEPVRTGSPLQDILDNAGRPGDQAAAVFGMILFIAGGIHMIRKSKG